MIMGKRLDYQSTFDRILCNIDKNDFKVNNNVELLFTIADTISVFKDNQMMTRTSGIIAYISLKSENLKPFIMVDSVFETLSLKAQTFVIYHELGHYQNGDFLLKSKFKVNISTKIKSKFKKEYPMNETLADYYAIDKMGSIEDGIDSLLEIHEKILSLIKDPKQIKKINNAFDLRMKAIYKMINNGPYFIDIPSKDYIEVFSDEDYNFEKENAEIEKYFKEESFNDSMKDILDIYGDRLLNELNKSNNKGE